MLETIEQVPFPEWLKGDDFHFNIKDILKDSCYYPASWFDGDPIRYLGGNVYSFIYVDYLYTKEKIEKETALGLRGYNLIHQQYISEDELTPKDLTRFLEPDFKDPNERKENLNGITKQLFRNKPFASWVIFEKKPEFDEAHGPKRISLLFIRFEGVFAYQALYLYHKIRPLIIAVIQPGTGFGGNWTNFYSENCFFYRTVHYYNEETMLPTYFVTNSVGKAFSEWPNYTSLIDGKNRFNFPYEDRVRMSYDGHLYFWKLDSAVTEDDIVIEDEYRFFTRKRERKIQRWINGK